MFIKFVLACFAIAFCTSVNCKTIQPVSVSVQQDDKVEGHATLVPVQEIQSTIFNEKLVEGVHAVEEPIANIKTNNRQARIRVTSLNDALNCGFNVECLLDTVETVVRERRALILAEADLQFRKSSLARDVSDSENISPSELAATVEGIISKITDIFKDTVTSWFRDYQGDEVKPEEDTAQEVDEELEGEKDRQINDNGESRGKKKKKLKNLMKFLILGAVLKAKLTVLLQLLSAALQVKFFFIALAGLLINKIRLWYDLKKGHQPQKVIYYEHAQHQHHYDNIEDEHHGGSGGFWGRAYEVPADEKEENAQNMAYRGQRPIPLAKHHQH